MYLDQNSTRIKKAWTAATKGDTKWKLTMVKDERIVSKGSVRIHYNNVCALAFDIHNMPHCCGMGIVAGIYHYDERFALEDLVALAEAIGRDNEWTQLVYTTNQEQTEIVEALTKCGWSKVKQFTSMTTESTITVWMKRILTKLVDSY